MRVFDGQERADRPWMPNPKSVNGDHFATSIVNKQYPDIFEGGNSWEIIRKPGLVLASSPEVQRRISCAYYKDAGSDGKTCPKRGGNEWCIPGCNKNWCEDGRKWDCGYPPHLLHEMMNRQARETPPGPADASKMAYGYNEIILDVWRQRWEDSLPEAIVAFFVQPLATAAEKRAARYAHQRYVSDKDMLDRHPATLGRTPLVTYDPRASRAPFALLPRE